MLLSKISQRNSTEVGILGTVSPGHGAAMCSIGGVPIAMEALRSSVCRCMRARWCRVPPKCVNQASVRGGELRRFQANLCCRTIGEHALQNCDRINRCFEVLDSCMSVAIGACAAQSAQGSLQFFAAKLVLCLAETACIVCGPTLFARISMQNSLLNQTAWESVSLVVSTRRGRTQHLPES